MIKRLLFLCVLGLSVVVYAAATKNFVQPKTLTMLAGGNTVTTTFTIGNVQGFKSIFGHVIINQGDGDSTDFGDSSSYVLTLNSSVGLLSNGLSTKTATSFPGTMFVHLEEAVDSFLLRDLTLTATTTDSVGAKVATAVDYKIFLNLQVID